VVCLLGPSGFAARPRTLRIHSGFQWAARRGNIRRGDQHHSSAPGGDRCARAPPAANMSMNLPEKAMRLWPTHMTVARMCYGLEGSKRLPQRRKENRTKRGVRSSPPPRFADSAGRYSGRACSGTGHAAQGVALAQCGLVGRGRELLRCSTSRWVSNLRRNTARRGEGRFEGCRGPPAMIVPSATPPSM